MGCGRRLGFCRGRHHCFRVPENQKRLLALVGWVGSKFGGGNRKKERNDRGGDPRLDGIGVIAGFFCSRPRPRLLSFMGGGMWVEPADGGSDRVVEEKNVSASLAIDP